MKLLAGTLLLFVAAAPSWAAKKITVQELKETLVAMHQANKSDPDVATRLKQLELSEEMTPAAKMSLAIYVPGTLSAEQIEILQGQSALLAPPAADLPTVPPPSAAGQQAILAKAVDHVSKTVAQNPHLTASKSTTRFQDDVINMSSSAGLNVASPNTYSKLWDARSEQVESERGTEKAAPSKAKTKWGENGEISEGEPGPNLSALLQEASAGKIGWLRWQTIDGKQIAVFSYAVEKKKTHFTVFYCCFPNTETQSGIAASGTFVPIPGEIQSLTSWKLFKKAVGYHGELFIDPDTGAVVRAITRAELKPSDFVHQEDIRIDYAPVVVDGKEYELPVDAYIMNQTVPGGDAGTAVYSSRHSLFIVRYANYKMAGR
jgi:hypothetical protein